MHFSEFTTSKGVSLSIYSSNSHGRSISQVHLETAPSKVAELQVGKTQIQVQTEIAYLDVLKIVVRTVECFNIKCKKIRPAFRVELAKQSKYELERGHI